MKTIYPVIFTQTKEGVVLIEVPDLEILTQGNDMGDAIDMARDAIGLKGVSMEDKAVSLPEASGLGSMDLKNSAFAEDGVQCVSLVDIDLAEYRRRIDTKTVRRNVTLPNWLNQEADKARINVSKVLQEALMEKLNVAK